MNPIRECMVCQKNKAEQTFSIGLPQPLPIPNWKRESISIDFIARLSQAQGKDCLYMVVHCLTKQVHFLAISTKYGEPQVIDVFFKKSLKLHGITKNIVNDRYSRFLSLFWLELFKLGRTKLRPSTCYHPQTDGQTKIDNKWLEV